MEIAKLTYSGELRTNAVHLKSLNELITDAPIDNQGKGEAFSPTDLLCVSLGACMLTIMGIVAKRNEINIEGTKILVSKIMKQEPRRVGEIIVEFFMPPAQYTDKQKDLLKNAATSCPVAKSLSEEIKQDIIFNY